MGNQQQKNQQKRKLESQPEIDIISDIFEPQPSDIRQRAIQAIRISQKQREDGSLKPESSVNNTSDIPSPTLEYLCILPRKSSSTPAEQEKWIQEGVLIKQEPSLVFQDRTERYCFLSEKKFIYNEHQGKFDRRAGILNFDLLSCSIEVQMKKNSIQHFRIKVHGSEKLFIFNCSDEQQTRKWVQLLTEVTEKSFGRQYNLTYLSHYHRFWRKDYFSQKQFREKAQTGDIILMRGMGQSAAMQRAITLEEYDHVALVLKNVKNQVLLFEANGAVGVGVLPWHRFISKQYYKQQQIVVYRKLKVNRTEQFYELFEDFVQRNMGRKYKFSVNKFLMKRQSISQEDNKSYFCSSLVAKLYKNLQLLDEKKSSVQYLPHSFTEKQALELRQNGRFGPAKLGKEHIIVFQKLFYEKPT